MKELITEINFIKIYRIIRKHELVYSVTYDKEYPNISGTEESNWFLCGTKMYKPIFDAEKALAESAQEHFDMLDTTFTAYMRMKEE